MAKSGFHSTVGKGDFVGHERAADASGKARAAAASAAKVVVCLFMVLIGVDVFMVVAESSVLEGRIVQIAVLNNDKDFRHYYVFSSILA